MAYDVIFRRGLRVNLPASSNYVGEPFFCTDTGELFVWNGTRMVEITAYAGSVSVADLASVEGNGTKVQLTNQGVTVNGDVVTYDANGNVQDSGTLLSSLVPKTTTVNGHALSANVVVSASDITTGTLPHAQLPTLLSGDIPNNAANTSGTAGGLSANIAESQVTNLVSDLAAKAPLASPAFTGTPTAPTASLGDDSTNIATTAFVENAVDNLVAGDIPNIAESQVTNLVGDLAGKVATTVTVNGHALSSNVTISASDLTTGTLPHAQLPSLVSGDIPNNAANTSGSSALVVSGSANSASAGVVRLANTDAIEWRNNANSANISLTKDTSDNLDASGFSGIKVPNSIIIASQTTAGHYLRNNGTSYVDSAIQAGDVPTLNQNTSGTAANLSGTPALPNGTTATTQATSDNSTNIATTAFVYGYRAVNPMTTLGDTDYGGASGVETRLAGNTTTTKKYLSQTGNGSVSAAPAWAQIAAADLSDGNSGTGSIAHATSPTFVTPTLGAASATTVNGLTITSSTGTLTVVNGKTAKFDNTIEFAGTDSTVITFQGTGTVVNRDSTDTLTNKTFDTAGTGNVFKINGTGVSAVTGSGSVVLATSPTISAPTLSGTTAMASATLSGTITSYNGTATQRVGVRSIIGFDDQTAQGANIGAKDLVSAATMSTDMQIQITAMWQVTRAASGGSPSSTLPSVVITWTDKDSGAAQSQTVAPSNTLYAGAGGVATGNTTTTRGHCVLTAYCKSGVALQYATTSFATAGTTSMQYAIHITAERIG
jgi:hypothetical protein